MNSEKEPLLEIIIKVGWKHLHDEIGIVITGIDGDIVEFYIHLKGKEIIEKFLIQCELDEDGYERKFFRSDRFRGRNFYLDRFTFIDPALADKFLASHI